MLDNKLKKLEKYFQEKKFIRVKAEAEKLLKKNSNLVQAMQYRAIALIMLGRFTEAQGDLDKALKTNPTDTALLGTYVNLYYVQHDNDNALKYATKALEIAPNDLYCLEKSGEIYLRLHEYDKAILAFKDAYFKGLRTEELFCKLAESLLQVGRIEEAQDFLNNVPKDNLKRMQIQLALFIDKGEVEQGLSLVSELTTHKKAEVPSLINAYRQLGDVVSAKKLALSYRDAALPESALPIITFGGVDEQWLERYLGNYPEERIAPKDKIQYLSAIAAYYKKKDQKKWFYYISKRNCHSLSSNEKFDIYNELSLLEKVVKAHQQVELKPRDSSNKTPIFIVGMPRSGTTLTETIIGTHSQCFHIGESEALADALNAKTNNHDLGALLNYIDDLSSLDLDKVAKDYLRLVRNHSKTANHLVDKMPHNFLHVGVIAKVFPNAKIIHCRRNPINTCISIFEQSFPNFHGYGDDLETLIPYYKEYQKIMTYWQESLPEGSFYQLDYEALTANPEDEVRKLLAYCQLPFEQQCLGFHLQKRTIKTASIEQVRQAIYPSKSRWIEIAQQVKPLLKAFPEYVS